MRLDYNLETVVRRNVVEEMTGLSRSTIYDKLNSKSPRFDPEFPKPLKLGVRSVGWVSREVQAWLKQRMSERQEGL